MIIWFLTHFPLSGNAQYLTPTQREALRLEVQALVERYAEALELTSDGVTVDPVRVTRLREAFIETSRGVVHNDLLPPKVEGSQTLSPVAYANFAQRSYPDGLDVEVSVKGIEIKDKAEGGAFQATVHVDKRLHGFYLGRRIHSYSGAQFLYVKAYMTNDKVERIGISRVVEPKGHANLIANRRIAGLYAGLSGGYQQSLMYNPALFGNASWGFKPGYSLSPAFELHWMITRGFGLGTGLRMVSATTSLNPQPGVNTIKGLIDSDGDTYNLLVSTRNYSEVATITSTDIPLLLKLRRGNRRVGLYMNLGVVFSFYSSGFYTQEGVITRSGEYPRYNVTLSNIPEYGFEQSTLNGSNEIAFEVPSNGYAAMLSLGLSASVARNLMLRVGITSTYGVNPLLTTVYRNNFVLGAAMSSNNGAHLLTSAVEVGLYYRFLRMY